MWEYVPMWLSACMQETQAIHAIHIPILFQNFDDVIRYIDECFAAPRSYNTLSLMGPVILDNLHKRGGLPRILGKLQKERRFPSLQNKSSIRLYGFWQTQLCSGVLIHLKLKR